MSEPIPEDCNPIFYTSKTRHSASASQAREFQSPDVQILSWILPANSMWTGWNLRSDDKCQGLGNPVVSESSGQKQAVQQLIAK